jgi:peptidoglycan LD-endopeptidase LytH
MKPLLLFFILFFLSRADPIVDWGVFEVKVRDRTIAKADAKKEFRALYDSLIAMTRNNTFAIKPVWTFPVAGYSKKDIGAGGFKPDIRYGSSPVKGYDFYDGNRHGGHPAYDIFIRDSNRDCRDDRTGKPAVIVAPVDLLILSINTGWRSGSEIRGGNYIWALYPPENLLYYFAHLDSVSALPGRIYRAGDTIASVGRTGKNAEPKRSPTHVHCMVLKVKGNSLVPIDWSNRIK